MADDHDFETGDSGASITYPMQASAVRKNGHLNIKGHPCRVVEMSTSKTGKHGHAKIHFVAIDIFTGKKYEDIVPSTHNAEIPNVKRQDYQLTDIDDEDFMSLMGDTGDIREDIKVPDTDVGKDIRKRFDNNEELMVTIIKAMNEEMAISVKTVSSKQ